MARTILADIDLAHTDRQRGAATWHAYSAACDPSDDGTPFEIGGQPSCPTCGGTRPASCEHTGEHLTRDVPEPTHQRWLALTPDQRLALVREKVTDSLSA